jgi:hypothetical protein
LQIGCAPLTVVRHGEHSLPHVASAVSSEHLPLQSCVPEGQTHVPAEHILPPLHALSQPPQCSLSVFTSTQASPQAMRPLLHSKAHAPARQTASARATIVRHCMPQAPQFCGSFMRSTQACPQSVGEAAGQPDTQPSAPAHIGVPAVHAVPQSPQCSAVLRSVSQPNSGSIEQLAQPAAHAEASNSHLPCGEQVTEPTTFGSRVQS